MAASFTICLILLEGFNKGCSVSLLSCFFNQLLVLCPIFPIFHPQPPRFLLLLALKEIFLNTPVWRGKRRNEVHNKEIRGDSFHRMLGTRKAILLMLPEAFQLEKINSKPFNSLVWHFGESPCRILLLWQQQQEESL